MTLPQNLTEGHDEWAKGRGESANRGMRKKGPSDIRGLPRSRSYTDEQIRQAGIQVARMAPDEAEELLSMLGITQHLTGKESLTAVSAVAASFDTRRRK